MKYLSQTLAKCWLHTGTMLKNHHHLLRPKPVTSASWRRPILKNDGVKVSWDDDIPNISKNKRHVPNHQPGTGLNQIVFHTKCSGTSTRSNCQRMIFGTPEMRARLRTIALVALFGLPVVSSWACTMTRKNHMGLSENGVYPPNTSK